MRSDDRWTRGCGRRRRSGRSPRPAWPRCHRACRAPSGRCCAGSAPESGPCRPPLRSAQPIRCPPPDSRQHHPSCTAPCCETRPMAAARRPPPCRRNRSLRRRTAACRAARPPKGPDDRHRRAAGHRESGRRSGSARSWRRRGERCRESRAPQRRERPPRTALDTADRSPVERVPPPRGRLSPSPPALCRVAGGASAPRAHGPPRRPSPSPSCRPRWPGSWSRAGGAHPLSRAPAHDRR